MLKIKEKFIIGVDIGGTWVRVAMCSADLNLANLKSKTAPTPQDDEYSISRTVTKLISELMMYRLVNPDQILGIGLATAGPIDLEKGEIFNNANLGFDEIPIKRPLQEEFPEIPIYLINDCNAAVLGVHYFEAEEYEKENLVYITMSTGLGGGVICNGHLLLGKEGNAAEIGHGIVEPNSDIVCNCGAYGCWEVYSSGTGMKNRVVQGIETGELNSMVLMKVVNYNKQKLSAKEIFQAAKKGDELSKKVVDDCIFYSKVGIGLVNNFYDCRSIYIGGAMMKDASQILPPIRQQFELDPLRFTINHPPEIKVTTLGDDVGIKGAFAYVKYKSENHPIVS